MNPSLLVAWRAHPWAVLCGGSGPSFSEAASVLKEGLAALGVDAEVAGGESSSDRFPIVLDSSGHESLGYAFRVAPERMEFFGDSEAALPLAAAAFLEALGAKALAPDREARVEPELEAGNAPLASSPLFPELTLVLRELPEPRDMPKWRAWARSRGFGTISTPQDESALSAPDAKTGSSIVLDLDAKESAARARLLFEELRRSDPEARPRFVARAGGIPEFAEAYLGAGEAREPLPTLIVDDSERCRAHALGDRDCERNAAIFSADLDSALARWKAAGGRIFLRLRYDDDLLFPLPCPPQTALIARDLARAAERGLDGIEYVASTRLPDRPSLNAWVFSALASPPPKRETASDRPSAAALELQADAALGEFRRIASATEKTFNGEECSVAAWSEYHACLEEAWAEALDRGLDEGIAVGSSLAPFGRIAGTVKELLKDPPEWPLDPWREDRARQERRAAALSEAYGKLDRCAELLGDIPASEAPAFRAHEAAIELAGVMRALYAEDKASGSPSGLAMMAEGAIIVLRRKLAELYRPRELPGSAKKFLVEAYRFRLAGLYNKGARGPIGALRSAIFKIGLLVNYR